MARWRQLGVDRLLREAWERGAIMVGGSAGAGSTAGTPIRSTLPVSPSQRFALLQSYVCPQTWKELRVF